MQKPGASYTPRIYKNHQTIFGGINHTAACGEGEIYDMKNIGNGDYPVLTPRPVRLYSETTDFWNYRWYYPDSTEYEEIYGRPKKQLIYRYDKTYIIEETLRNNNGELINSTSGKYLGLLECPRKTSHSSSDLELAPVGNNYVLTAFCVSADRLITINNFVVTTKSHKAFYTKVIKRVQTLDKLKNAQNTNKIMPTIGDVYAVSQGGYDGQTSGQSILSMAYRNYEWNGSEWKAPENIQDRDLEQSVEVSNVVFQDGTYKDESAEANTMYCANGFPTWIFPGDGIKISGCVAATSNNKTAIVREISADRKYLRFYENTFTTHGLDLTATSVTEASITLSRECPDMNFMCECGNRLFGCTDDTIYACKLGDPFNWNVFDGLSTDSYSVDVASAGEFTGCADYNGYVLFFKPDRIYKLYNIEDTPKNWRLTELETYGLKTGCGDTLAQADNYLFWLSPRGVVRYSGSYPEIISEPLGLAPDDTGIGGTDGQNYYISIKHADETSTLYMFDTQHGIWFKHDDIEVKCFERDKYGLVALEKNWPIAPEDDHVTRLHGIPDSPTEVSNSDRDTMESFVEFGDIMNNTTEHKYISQLGVTAEVSDKGRLDFYLSTDSGTTWQEMGSIGPSPKTTTILPITPVRCDFFRIKIVGKGQWKIYAIARGYMSGTDR